MNFSLAKKEDATALALIHKAEIEGGFLSSLSDAFLIRFYRALIQSPSSFCVVAKENGAVAGFIAGVANMNAFYAYFLKHYLFQSFFILLPKIFSSLKKILESLWYPKKESSLPKAELLTIAISKKFQGKGIGSLMLSLFISEMKKRNVAAFKAVVGKNLTNAIKFYENNGFVFSKNTFIHGRDISRVYIFNINS